MKTLFVLVLASLWACAGEGPTGSALFNYNRSAASFFHAVYRFSHPAIQDTDIAVRIQHHGDHLAAMAVKNITKNEERMTMNLTKQGNDFGGSSAGSAYRHGGTYVVSLASGVCCGAIQFTPDSNTSLTFSGTKIKDLTASEWDVIINPPPTEGTFYAKYNFTTTNNNDETVDYAELAVRIEYSESVANQMELIGIDPSRKGKSDTVALTMAMQHPHNFHSGDVDSKCFNGKGSYTVHRLSNGGCCGSIQFFKPTNTGSLVKQLGAGKSFFGNMTAELSYSDWAVLTVGDSGILEELEKVSHGVGSIFTVNASDSMQDQTVRLEAHSASGKVANGLAHWVALDNNAYDITLSGASSGSASSGSANVFFTEQAVNSVVKLVASVNGEKKGEIAAITSYGIASLLKVDDRGRVRFEMLHDNPGDEKIKVEVMMVDDSGIVKKGGLGKKYEVEGEVIPGGRLSRGGNLYLLSPELTCENDHTVFARVVGRSRTHYVSCPSSD